MTKHKMRTFNHGIQLTLHPDIWMIFLTQIIYILTVWKVKYILQNFSLIEPIPLIPKPCFSIFICQFLMILFPPKIYDKRDENFEIVNFPFLDGDVPRSTSCKVYISRVISQLIRFARASSHVTDFNTHNKLSTQKLLKQGFQYHQLRKTFSEIYRQYYALISNFYIRLLSLIAPEFYSKSVNCWH